MMGNQKQRSTQVTFTVLQLIFLGSILLSCAYPLRAQFDKTPFDHLPDNVAYMGDLSNRHLNEVSGLAASRLSKNLLWVLNDSGDGPRIYAIDSTGIDIGRVTINGATNFDWEDMASFQVENTAYLLIADIGDNQRIRPACTLYIIEEPVLSKMKFSNPVSADPVCVIRFTYEDGPKDGESVAVDAANKRIYLLTKRQRPPIFYELPLDLQTQTSVQVARPVIEIADLQKPTSMDLSPNGFSLAVLTYKDAFLFRRNSGEQWPIALSRKPQKVIFPALAQQEAICFSHDGKAIFVTSEQRPSPVLRIDLD
jgi:hypothetical protein